MIVKIGLIASICFGITIVGIILGFFFLQVQTKF